MIQKLKSLKNHQGFMKYFKNTSWLFAEKILRMIVGLFIGVWVARYLGPEQFGTFSYAQSFVGLFSAIATLGLDGIVIRELVKDKNKGSLLIGTAFYLKLLGAILVLTTLAVVINFTSNDEHTNILIFIIASATIFQSFNVVDMYFQAKVMSKYIVYVNASSLFISSVVKITLILMNAPLVDFAWVVLFDSFILALGFSYFYIKINQESNEKFNLINLKYNKSIAINLLKDAWPMAITMIIVMAYININQILLGNYLGKIELGYYTVALKISSIINFIPSIIVGSLFPSLVNLDYNSELYKTRVQALFNMLVLISVLFIVTIYFFGDFILLTLYGQDYLKSIEVLKYLSILYLFSSVGYLSGRLFIIYNLEKLYLLRATLGLLFLIIFSVKLIPEYGIQGAVFSLLISELVVVFLSDLLFFSKTKFIFFMKLKSLYLFLDIRYYLRIK